MQRNAENSCINGCGNTNLAKMYAKIRITVVFNSPNAIYKNSDVCCHVEHKQKTLVVRQRKVENPDQKQFMLRQVVFFSSGISVMGWAGKAKKNQFEFFLEKFFFV